MKKFGIGLLISGVLTGLGFHYWELRWQLQTSNFKNDLYESEHRILRDEINELRAKKTYEHGCLDTVIRMKLDNGFEDGLLRAFTLIETENSDVASYHRATEHHWAMVYYQQKIAEQKLKEEKEKSYTLGRQDGYETAISDVKKQDSHPDYTPRPVVEVQE